MSISEASRLADEWSRRAYRWLRRAEWWQLAMVAVFALMVLPLVPAALTLALIGAFVVFARAWAREFGFLMRLDDDAFPGRNDKLIWAILLIVLPPVGAWMFGGYRESRWPAAKPGRDRGYDGF